MKLFLNEVPIKYFYVGMKLINIFGEISYVKDVNYSSSYGKGMLMAWEDDVNYTSVIYYSNLNFYETVEVVIGKCKILKALLKEKVDHGL